MTYEIHQLVEPEPMQEPEEEMDEVTAEDLLTRSYYILNALSEKRMPAVLRDDLLFLMKDIEEAICWHHMH
jgi:hypothetical protein